MSLKTFINKLFDAGEHYIVAIGKAEIKIAANSKLGQAISTAITAGEDGSNTVDKLERAVVSLLPTLRTYIADPKALESDIQTVAKAMIEGALSTLKTTAPVAILEAIGEAL